MRSRPFATQCLIRRTPISTPLTHYVLRQCSSRRTFGGLTNTVEQLRDARAEVAIPAAAAPSPRDLELAPEGLPPRDTVVVDFIGRRAELARLWEWVVDPHSKRWLLTGDGGKGKSAIAYQFATEIIHNPEVEFAAVHWLSAKRRRFSEGEVMHIAEPEFFDLESAIDRLLAEFGWSEHIRKPLETKRSAS